MSLSGSDQICLYMCDIFLPLDGIAIINFEELCLTGLKHVLIS